MGMDLVFNKIVDGERIERIKSFPINFLRNVYPELVRTITKNISNYDSFSNETYICPSTRFMVIYDEFNEFCKEKNTEFEEKKAELIKVITEDEGYNKIRYLVDNYLENIGKNKLMKDIKREFKIS